MQSARQIPNVKKVVMDAPRLDEGALGPRDEQVHKGREPRGHHLGHNFGDRVDEANRSKI